MGKHKYKNYCHSEEPATKNLITIDQILRYAQDDR